MIRRFDIGWRSRDGDHGVIAAPDGPLLASEASRLMAMTDLVHEPFEQYWALLAFADGFAALMRISPVSGGTRGQASSAQVLVPGPTLLPWAVDPAGLLALFPVPPKRVTESAAWSTGAGADVPIAVLGRERLTAEHFPPGSAARALLVKALMAPARLEESMAVPVAATIGQEDQVIAALRVWNVLPRTRLAAGLRIVTSRVPKITEAAFAFHSNNDAAAPNGAGQAFAELWLRCIEAFGPSGLAAEADISSPLELMTWYARIVMPTPADAEALVAGLFAASLGPLSGLRSRAIDKLLGGPLAQPTGRYRLALSQALSRSGFDLDPGTVQWAVELLLHESVFDRMPGQPLMSSHERHELWDWSVNHAAAALQRCYEALPLPLRIEVSLACGASLAGRERITPAQRMLGEHLFESLRQMSSDASACRDYNAHIKEALDSIGPVIGRPPPLERSAPLQAAAALADTLAFSARRAISRGTPPHADERRMLLPNQWVNNFRSWLHELSAGDFIAELQGLIESDRGSDVISVFDAMEATLGEDDRMFLPLLREAAAGWPNPGSKPPNRHARSQHA